MSFEKGKKGEKIAKEVLEEFGVKCETIRGTITTCLARLAGRSSLLRSSLMTGLQARGIST